MSDANKELVRRLLERADGNDSSVLDEVLSPEYVDHNPPPFQGPETGLPGARSAFKNGAEIFSGWHHEVLDQFTDGDYVATRYTITGTHEGDLMGTPPSGKDVAFSGITISRCKDGRIAEEWELTDTVALLGQVGALSAITQH